ncbi:MAG: glycosyltransferase [Acidobacteriota bacterium]
MSQDGKQGTLLVVASSLGHARGSVVDRAQALAHVWNGPVSLLITSQVPRLIAKKLLPEKVTLVMGPAEAVEALSDYADSPQARAALVTLTKLASQHAPLERLYVLADEKLLGLLPAIAESVFPAGIDVELLPSAGIPDAATLWPWCDGLIAAERERLYPLSGGQPALPARSVPLGMQESALRALTHLPAFGGQSRLSVVVPVRGQWPMVLRMADSVLQYTPELLELILVDDFSPDETRSKLERTAAKDMRVRLFAHDSQRGFAATVNRGIAAARGDMVIVLNADTVVTPNWSTALCHHLQHAELAGAVGPLSNRVAGLQQLQPVEYQQGTLEGLNAFADRVAQARPGRASGVARLTGLCLAIGRPTLRRIGGFDTRFFPGNFEDDDWCLRLLAGGLIPYRADDVFIHHEGSQSFVLEPTAYRDLLELNWQRFKQKWDLPADRPIERSYSIEEVALSPYSREKHYLAPWESLQAVLVEP